MKVRNAAVRVESALAPAIIRAAPALGLAMGLRKYESDVYGTKGLVLPLVAARAGSISWLAPSAAAVRPAARNRLRRSIPEATFSGTARWLLLWGDAAR